VPGVKRNEEDSRSDVPRIRRISILKRPRFEVSKISKSDPAKTRELKEAGQARSKESTPHVDLTKYSK